MQINNLIYISFINILFVSLLNKATNTDIVEFNYTNENSVSEKKLFYAWSQHVMDAWILENMNGLQNKIREEKKSFTYTLPYIQGNVAELAKVEGNCAAFINHFISSECVESGWKDWNINELKELDICATYFSFIYDDLVYDIKCQLYSHLPHDVIIRLINTPTKKSYNDYKLSIKPIMEKFEKSSFILKEIKKDIAKINGDNDKNANE